MSPGVVCDASALVAILLDAGSDGAWATQALAGAHVLAPSLLSFECANIIRRHELARLVSPDQAVQAHADLVAMPLELWPYEAVATRVWELRHNLSSYDSSYVAVAELAEADLITLDRRISRTPGLRIAVRTPEPFD
ncbi:MAG TPA: type II toxin-antitoxin system VapC family toxin [Propionibacteriaceae bacterium]|nr:type II toxin-antitoxin system VapC family toxin [Propionibacteriaceae bacterium]